MSFATSLKSEISKLFSVQALAHLLIVDYCAMASSYPDVVTSLLLFITLPVTVASAERSFLKLRLIKNYYLRGKMGQERLSALALLSTEAQRAEALDTDKLVDSFAEAKARRMQLC